MNNWVKALVVPFLPEWFYLLSYKKPTSSMGYSKCYVRTSVALSLSPEFQHFLLQGRGESKSRLLFSNSSSVLCGGKKKKKKRK